MRAVLDTNVLVAFLLTRGRTTSAILDSWERGDFELLTSPPLIAEVRRTLEKLKLRRRIRLTVRAEFPPRLPALYRRHDRDFLLRI